MLPIVQCRITSLLQLILIISFCFFTQNLYAFINTEGIQVYQNTLTPEHKLKLASDITRYRNAENIWDVLREEFTLPHYEDNPAVQEKIEWFMNNQDFLLRSATRAAPYLYYILQQVRIRHLPVELVLLPIIESGYNPFSLSYVGAAGIWQLMPGTANDLGIKRNGWYDGRRDVIASTRAALNYLKYLQSFFEGNWLYAIAAYNTGEGNVQAAIKKNVREGRDADFWSLGVAQQTRDYVPSLLALAVIISHPEKYPVYFPPVRNAPYLAQINIGAQINLKYAANLAGLSFKQLMQLNPGFNTAEATNKGKLVLPIENVEQFADGLARSPERPTINWLHYKVKAGESLLAIAKKFDTTPNAIRKLNHLNKNNAVARNANLLIPYNGQKQDDSDEDNIRDTESRIVAKTESLQKDVLILSNNEKTDTTYSSQSLAEKISNKYALQPGDTIYMVRAKDTIETIAKRFNTSAHVVQMANQLHSKHVTPGMQLVIPHHYAEQPTPGAETLAPGDTIYMVRRGDTIETIAKRFHTSASAIRLANLVNENSLMEGEKLVVPTHISG